MKIFVNRKIRRTPWGGGIHFLSSFVDYVTKLGHEVTNNYDNDVDLILMMDPRPDDGFGDVNQIINFRSHLKSLGKNVKVFHRINDTDIARNTNFLVNMNLTANFYVADYTIFISEWLKKHYEDRGFNKESIVIRNGCNQDWFYPKNNYESSLKKGPIKVVTHHWSDNFNKGFDAYISLDKQLENRNDIEFTYIGRYFKDYSPIRTKIIAPIYGVALGDELRKHDVYLTAARWEACGMHHIEAASCGLPIIYHTDGGGINELCKNYGVEFSEKNADKLCDIISDVFFNKKLFIEKIDYSSLNSDNVNDQYVKFIEEKIKIV